jgi:tetratricopeptide (TPR) repeat protein
VSAAKHDGLQSLTGVPISGFRPAVWAPIVLCTLGFLVATGFAVDATLSRPAGALAPAALLAWSMAAVALWLAVLSARNRKALAAQVLRRRGLKAVRSGHYDVARECFLDSLAIFPRSWEAHYYLGLAATRADRLQAAREHFEAGLSVAPAEVALRWALASTAEQLGDFARAQALLDAILEECPSHADARCLLGCLQEQTGDVEAARRSYEQVIARTPRHSAALENLARLDRSGAGGGRVEAGRTEQ